MNLLLDTHTLIWFLNGDAEPSDKARKAIENNEDISYVSIASIWEITIKINLRKLEMKLSLSELEEKLSENNFQLLPLSFSYFLTLSNLPLFHRDPFDRIIIAQAITDNLMIVTIDTALSTYNVKCLW